MALLLPSEECPKCRGPMKLAPSMLGAVYTCERCDADAPSTTSNAGLAASWHLRHPETQPTDEMRGFRRRSFVMALIGYRPIRPLAL
jgi:hypothetical protein